MAGPAKNAAQQLFGYIPEPKRTFNPALQVGRAGLSLPLASKAPDLPSKGLLKVTGYVHNRVTICAYQGGSKRVGKRLKFADLAAGVKAVPNFNQLRKTRQMLKVGGRWRELPLRTKFTSRAKNMLKDAGTLIESNCKGVGLFVTLTMAGGTEKSYEAMGIASGYVVDRFNRWLRYRVSDGFFGYVWELQQRGAPHLHYLFRMPSGTDFVEFYTALRQEWRQILLDVSAESGVDLFERVDGGTHRENPNLPGVNIQVIRGRVAGYLAKYASKGRTKDGSDSPFIPGRWWGVSYAIRKEVLMRRVSFIFGSTSIERSVTVLNEIMERLHGLIKEVWRPTHEKAMPGEFVSIDTGKNSPALVARAIREWFDSGDVSLFARLEVIPPVMARGPT